MSGTESLNPAMDTKVLNVVLIALAFSIPISISLAEPLAFIAIAVWIFMLRQPENRQAMRCNPMLVFVVVFILAAVSVSLVWGIRPSRSVDKFHRLSFLFLAFVCEAGLWGRNAGYTRAKIRSVLLAFIAGCTVLGLYDMVRVPLHAMAESSASLYDAGNMRDPQFYMVGLCLLIALWISGIQRGRLWLWCVTFVANLAGLVLHFKRGVWIAFFMALVLLVIRAKRWRILVLAVLCAAGMLLVPQVRQRVEDLREISSEKAGGRYVLWTETAPALFEAYPLGMGWSAVNHQDFVDHSEHFVQKKLNHLHNNFLQMRLELGWVGATAWSMMMLFVLYLLFFSGGFQEGVGLDWMGPGLLSGFFGLLLNGQVEANFSDTEIIILFGYIMGLAVILWRVGRMDKEKVHE